MRKLLTFLIACATLGGSLTAQVTSVYHTVHAVDQAGPGLTTYRIFADLQDADDFLSSVYAASNDYLELGGDGNVVVNNASGSTTGDGLATGFCGFVPPLCFESFVTIGWYGTTAYDGSPIACGQATTTISSLPNASVIGATFGTNPAAPSLVMQDGAWFTTNLAGCNDNGFGIGVNNTVLIAQVTIPSTDDLAYNLNIQIFDAADGSAPILTIGDCNTVDPGEVDGSGLGLHYPADPGCSVAVDGCTDTTACNYDSAATNDDGSCEFLSCAGCTDTAACNYDSTATLDDSSCCFDNCVVIDITAGSFESEITWDLVDGLGNILYSGIAPETAGMFCLVDDCYALLLHDSFGDGWNGATYTVSDNDGNVLYTGTHAGGFEDVANIGLPGQCGCTDTTACNYDSGAVLDNGTCILPEANDDCANAIGLAVDGVATLVTNNCSTADGAAGASWFDGTVENDVWYSFTAPSSGGVLTIETSDDGTTSFNDTQLAVYDACGGTILADDDDSGASLYSLLTFDCDGGTGLVGGNTYVIQVDGYNGDAGTCNITLTFTDKDGCTDSTFANYDPCASNDDGSCTNGVPGCTDTGACNFDSAATNDDGSCEYLTCAGCTDTTACNFDSTASISDPAACCFDNCVTVTVGGGSFDSEITWELYDGLGGLVASGIAEVAELCLLTDCYTFVAIDSFGDGWNGASWTVDDNNGNVSTGGLGTGLFTESTPGVSVGQNCDPGCTDSAACNYDSSVSVDDGSCCYDNCLSIDLIDSFGDGWNGASYDIVDAATLLSVASGTMADGFAQTDGLCLLDGCYMVTVGGGSFDSEISWAVNGADEAAGGTAGSGSFSVNTASCFGCMDSTACNYDAAAMYDDGSCTFAPCIPNDEPAGATALSLTVLGTCSTISDDLSLAQSDNIEGTAFTLGASADLWYEFTAVTAGVRIEVSSAGGFDAVVELLDASNNSVDTEDVSFGTDEWLNVGDLTPGDTYRISVCAYDGTPASGDGDFTICVQYLPETTCDYGSGPYNLCDMFKADWVGPAVYTFNFTAVSDGQVYTADGDPWDFIQLFDVPSLPWGDDYTVLIDVKHMLTNVNGTDELPNVPGTVSCPITVNAPPSSVVKPADNCTNFGPKWMGQYIGSTPWVCGAADWEWEFTRTDVPELPINFVSGTAVNFVRLSWVPGLVEGGVYDVRVRPIFANGALGAFGAADCVSIVGPIGLPSVDGPSVDLLDEEKDLSDAAVAPEAAIYPNPNNGQILNVNLSGVESTVVTMDIIDMFGKTVQAEQITVATGNVNEVINLNGLASGVYNVRFTMNNTTQTERLVIEK